LGKTDEEFYEQLKSLAEMELKGKNVQPKNPNTPNSNNNPNLLKDLYEILDKKLNDEDFNLFCMLNFSEVHNNFAQGQNKRTKIANLLDYAKRKDLLEQLDSELKNFLQP
jgi:hypothetical protein